MPPMPDPETELGPEVLMMRNYLAELSMRHNALVADVAQEFNACAGQVSAMRQEMADQQNKMTITETMLMEHQRKLAITETTFLGHNQRIRGCDQLLNATGKDMADQVTSIIKAAEEIKQQVKRDIRTIEDYV